MRTSKIIHYYGLMNVAVNNKIICIQQYELFVRNIFCSVYNARYPTGHRFISHFSLNKLQTTTKITTSGDGCHCIHYAHQPGLCLGQGSVTLGQNTEKNDR